MIRKLFLIVILAVSGLALKAQFIDNKVNISLGPSLSLPLNSSTIILNNEFYYPSLFGNYTAGKGISALLDYHVSQTFWLGTQIDYTVYENWKGAQEKFILSQPTLAISSVSINAFFFPKNFQPETPSIRWAWSVSPLLSYHILGQVKYDTSGKQTVSQSSLHGGFKTGICLFYEINNNNLIRMNIFYQLEKVDNIYYLDKYHHSLNVAFYFSLKLLKNRYFFYE